MSICLLFQSCFQMFVCLLAFYVFTCSRYLTRLPHLAGSARNKALADYVATQWKQSHVDRVEIKSYSVLLSYPNTTQPNTVSITTANKTVVYECSKVEPPLTNDENTSNVTPPFNAYAASGVAHGELVYVNYGRVEDFQTLEKWNIDVRGKVAIARYGRIFRGDKARIAELAGMSGLILYSDPADVSGNSMNSESTYPHTWWLPSTGLQRGTLLLMDGDPLTPGYPSIPGAYRRSLADVKNDTLPHIPVQPISAKDAAILMSDLSGQVVPRTANGSNWQGGLGFVYHTGPGYEENTTKSNQHVSMKVHNTLEVQTIYNVIGTIDGSEEPDRYVLLGNHRDAWVFGGADPSSGTACLIEIVRAFGTLLASGWRPRRTIKFLSWDAEEYGLIGSTEWVEENSQILSKRAVAYLNVDIAVQGNYSIRAAASPLLYQTLYEAAKLVPSPTHDFSSLYDLWLHRTPKYPDNDVPYIGNLGSGSDYTAFQQHIGISSVDMRYNYDYTKYHISSYPTYHSIHDTFQYMTEFLDPQFQCHTTISKLWMQSALILSDRISLMFDLRDYSSALTQHVDELKSKYGDVLREKGISLEHLSHAVLNFSVIALELSQRADPCSELGWRMFNDQLMQLDRMFIVPSGLPGRPFLRLTF